MNVCTQCLKEQVDENSDCRLGGFKGAAIISKRKGVKEKMDLLILFVHREVTFRGVFLFWQFLIMSASI